MLSTCVAARSCQGCCRKSSTPDTQKNLCHEFNATKIPLCHAKPSIAATMSFFTTANAIEIYN
jgi:hypothetical protein